MCARVVAEFFSLPKAAGSNFVVEFQDLVLRSLLKPKQFSQQLSFGSIKRLKAEQYGKLHANTSAYRLKGWIRLID